MALDLDIPTIGLTPDPEWSEKINSNFQKINTHTHTGISGDGNKLDQNSLNIGDDLQLNNNSLTETKSIEFVNQNDSIETESTIWVDEVNGDLWYNNGGGTKIRITANNALNITALAPNSFEVSNINTNHSINSSDTPIFYLIDTSNTAIDIYLPSAYNAGYGRFYYIKDITGQANSNSITIHPDGTDEIFGNNSSVALNNSFGCWKLVSDGVNTWSLDLSSGQIDGYTLFGNPTNESNIPSQIQLNNTLEIVSNKIQRAAITGDVLINAGSNTANIGNQVIINNDISNTALINVSKFQVMGAQSLIGNQNTTPSTPSVLLSDGSLLLGGNQITVSRTSGKVRRTEDDFFIDTNLTSGPFIFTNINSGTEDWFSASVHQIYCSSSSNSGGCIASQSTFNINQSTRGEYTFSTKAGIYSGAQNTFFGLFSDLNAVTDFSTINCIGFRINDLNQVSFYASNSSNDLTSSIFATLTGSRQYMFTFTINVNQTSVKYEILDVTDGSVHATGTMNISALTNISNCYVGVRANASLGDSNPVIAVDYIGIQIFNN